MPEDQFTYYLNHQADLTEKYDGKFLIIRQSAVAGVFNSSFEAYKEISDKYLDGDFLLQRCSMASLKKQMALQRS